jgi:chromosome segregation ATPase
MKTLLIILLTILAGFCFYTSDPLILTTPAQIFTLLAVLGIGGLIGNMTKNSDKLKKVRKMNKSLLRANGNLRAKNEDQVEKIEYLTNRLMQNNYLLVKIYDLRTENEVLKKSLLSTQGNLKQVQKKYSEAKEQVTLLLFEITHLKETIAESDNALDKLKESGAITLMDKID